jgi:hypothetical protein
MQEARRRAAGFRRVFLIILVLAISALFFAVAWPFLKPLLLSEYVLHRLRSAETPEEVIETIRAAEQVLPV